MPFHSSATTCNGNGPSWTPTTPSPAGTATRVRAEPYARRCSGWERRPSGASTARTVWLPELDARFSPPTPPGNPRRSEAACRLPAIPLPGAAVEPLVVLAPRVGIGAEAGRGEEPRSPATGLQIHASRRSAVSEQDAFR